MTDSKRIPKVHIVYHKSDMDGWASCAIFKWALENKYLKFPIDNFEIHLIPYNYGFYFPFHKVEEQDMIIMVDASLPVEEMYSLYDMVRGKFIWIDHHITVLESLKDFKAIGSRSVEHSACMLSFQWIKNNLTELGKSKSSKFWENLERVYSYFDTYDIYNQDSNIWIEALTMNYLFGSLDINPEFEESSKYFWADVFASCESDMVDELIEDFVRDGTLIQTAFNNYDTQLVRAYGFEATFEGLKIFFINRGIGGSAVFSKINTDKYDAVSCFVYSGKKDLYSFSFYAQKPETNLVPIFDKYGGGGHKGAGGIRVKSFKYNPNSKEIELFQ